MALPEKLENIKKVSLAKLLIGLVISIVGVVSAYQATIYGLKTEIENKADIVVVTEINERLIRIETILNSQIATRDELWSVFDSLQGRLNRIEERL